MPDSHRRRRRVLAFAVLNLVLLGLVVGVFSYTTERYIERARPSTLIYRPHPFQRHVLAPGQTYRKGQVRFEIGPHSFRGPVPEMPKPEGGLRVYVVGGSAVFDHRVTGGESWPERLGPELEARGLGRVESFNGGVPGYASRETLAAWHDRVARFGPDVVLLYLGWNDVKYMRTFRAGWDVDAYFAYRGELEAQYRFLTAPWPLRNWYALEKMVTARLRATPLAENRAPPTPPRAAATPWAESGGLAFFRRNVETFVRRARADGALPVLVAQVTLVVPDLAPHLRERVAYRFVRLGHETLVEINDLMVDVLEAVAQAEDVPFVDVRPQMNGKAPFFADQVHLKAEGSRLLAWLLARALAPELQRRGLGADTSTRAGGRTRDAVGS
jgi:lysophospholipase L1-like esterase